MSGDLMVSDNAQEPEVYVDADAMSREMDEVEALLNKALLIGDPNLAFGYVRGVRALGQIKGMGIAKILYQTWTDWPQYQKMGVDDDWENVAPVMCGLALDQCRDYRDLMKNLYANPEVPDWVKKALVTKPLTGQLYLSHATHDLDDDDYKQLMDANTPNEMREIVRAKRGITTSSENRVVILEERANPHIIKAKKGTYGKYVVVGTLRAEKEDLEGNDYEHMVRSIAVERIRRAAGILQQ